MSSSIVAALRGHRFTRVAAAAALTFAAAGAVIADEQTFAAQHAAPGPRYFDLQAMKAASMPALARHRAAQDASPGPRYFDLEANKTRCARAR